MCSNQDSADNPVGVSDVYPFAELRINAFKNNKLVTIPDHLVFGKVAEVLNSDNESELSKKDTQIRHHTGYSLHVLYNYSETLRILRTNLSMLPYNNKEHYSNGM